MKFPDLLCYSCNESQADYLCYYVRYYPEKTLPAWVGPQLICQDCKIKLYKSCNSLDTRQLNFISFKYLAEMDKQGIGYITSKKGKEFNALNAPFWKKKVWRCHFAGKESLSECLKRLKDNNAKDLC